MNKTAAIPPWLSGALPRAVPVRLACAQDLAGLAGVQPWVGHGLGGDTAAVTDMLRTVRYPCVHTLN